MSEICGHHAEDRGKQLSLAANSSRLTSAVRIPTTPLRPGSSGFVRHEVAGSSPRSGERTAATHCHVSTATHPPDGTEPTHGDKLIWYRAAAVHRIYRHHLLHRRHFLSVTEVKRGEWEDKDSICNKRIH